ncbi:hypothetical protein KCU78_g19292, partial [Aureobasidium melanogenum]
MEAHVVNGPVCLFTCLVQTYTRAKKMMNLARKACKTYSSRDSHVVTHRSTNLPFNCLCMAERTGCPVFS